MKTEYSVLEALKNTIVTHVNEYLPETAEQITASHIDIDYPDIDNCKHNTQIFITPNTASYEGKTWGSDLAVFNVDIFILCKKAPNTTLIQNVFMYSNAIYQMLRNNQGLDGYIDFSEVDNLEYYPAIDPVGKQVAISLSLSLQWEKDFSEE